jgi:hypothetical protein
MTVQTSSNVHLRIEWDDSVVMVFSFDGPDGRTNCGFFHQILAVQVVQGSQTQISAALAQVAQQGVQLSLDPQTWVETVKTGARAGGSATVVFEDSISTTYTTQTNQTFQLQQLFSLAG